MADAAKDTFRRMEYPYTWTAKVVNFPWKFYFTKQWLWKTLPFGLLITSPLFYKISQASKFISDYTTDSKMRTYCVAQVPH